MKITLKDIIEFFRTGWGTVIIFLVGIPVAAGILLKIIDKTSSWGEAIGAMIAVFITVCIVGGCLGASKFY